MSKETDTGNESGYKTDTDEVEAIKTTIIPARDGLFQSTTTSTPELNVLSSSITDEGIVDPITQAIRDQILTAQREILRLEISRQNPELAEQLENDKKFREFLKNLKDEEEKRKLVYAVLNDKEIKGELEKIEINGYRNIHKQFENRFKPMLWDGDKGEDANKNTTQSQKVTNDVGDEICTLTETTHAINPIQILDGNNQPVTIKSYRTIDFPTKLDGAAGNMHLSIVALDKNGNKPSIDKAVYFTAHYEEGPNGKPLLKEISSPMPIKFMGEGKEAIGYIEHGGEIYTMPVTRGKYEAMMQEVAVNKGHSVDLSQTVKEIANDKVMNMSQEQGGKSIVDGYKAIAEKYADLQKNPEGKLPEELSKEELKDKTAFIKDLSNNNNSLGDKDKAVILDELVKYETERGEKAIGDGKIAIDKTIEMLDTEKGILNERITEQDKAKINSEQQQPILKNQEQGGKSIVDGYKAIAEKYADLQKNPEGKLPEELSKEELKDKTAFIKDLSNNNNSLDDKDKAVILDELVKYETERGEKAIGDGKIAIDKTIEMLDTEKGILNERITEQDKAKINSEQQQPILKNQEQGGKSIVDGYKAIAEKYADLQKNPEGKLPEELSKEELKDKTAFIKDLSNNNNSLGDKDKAVILDELVKYETERGEKAIGDGKIAIDKTIEMLDTEKGILNERITEQDKAKINSEQQQPILKNQEQGGKSIVDGYKAIAEKYADLQKNPEGKLPEELSKEELKDKTAFIKDLSNNNNSLDDKDKAVILDELVKYETERGEKAIGDGKIAIDKTIEMLDTEKGILNERITEQDKAKINSEQQQPILKNQEQGGKSIVDGYKAIAEKYADLQKNPEGKLPEELSKEELKDKTAFIKDLSNNNNSLDDKDKAVILDELVKYETERGEKAIGDGKIAIDKTIEMLDTEKGILNERITEQDKAKINSEQQQPILKNQEQGGKSIVDGYKAIAEKYADLQKNPEGKLPEELSKEELKDKTAFIKDLSNNNNSLGDKDKAVILDELVKYETERGEKAIGDGKIAIDKTIEMLDTEKGILNERITEQDKAKINSEQQQPILKNQEQGGKSIVDGYKAIAEKYADLQKNPEGKLPEELSKEELKDKTAFIKDLSNNNNSLGDKDKAVILDELVKYETERGEKAIGDGKIAIDKTIEMLDTEKGILNERITEQDKAKINSEQQQPILKNQEQGGKSIVDGYKAIAEKYADLQKNPEGKLPEELSKEELKDKTAFIKDLSNNNNSLGDKDKAVILDELVKYETERGEKAIGDGKIAIDKTIEMLDTEKGILNERITEQDKAKINSEQQQPILKNQEQGGKSIVDGYKAIAEKYADLQKNPEGKLPEELSKEELKDKTAFIKDLSNNNNSLDDKDKAVILDELVKYETERGEKAIGDGKIAIDKTIEMLDTEKGILNERITEQDKAKINSEQQQPILKNQEQGGKSIVDGYKAIAEKYADLQKNPEGKLPEELSKEELKDKTAFIKDLSNNNNSLDDKDKAVILDELVKYETERGEKAIGDAKIAIDKTIEMLDTEKGILNERITEQDKAKINSEQQQPILKNQEQGGKSIVDGYKAIAEKYADLQKNPEGKLPEELSKEELKDKTAFIKDLSNNNNSLGDKDKAVILDELVKYETERGEKAIGDGKIAIDKTIEMLDTEKGILNERITEQDKAKINSEQQQPILKNQEQGGKSIVDGYKAIAEKYADLQKNPEGKLPEELSKEELKDKTAFIKDLSNNNNSLGDKDKAVILDELVKYETERGEKAIGDGKIAIDKTIEMLDTEKGILNERITEQDKAKINSEQQQPILKNQEQGGKSIVDGYKAIAEKYADLQKNPEGKLPEELSKEELKDKTAFIKDLSNNNNSLGDKDKAVILDELVKYETERGEKAIGDGKIAIDKTIEMLDTEKGILNERITEQDKAKINSEQQQPILKNQEQGGKSIVDGYKAIAEKYADLQKNPEGKLPEELSKEELKDKTAFIKDLSNNNNSLGDKDKAVILDELVKYETERGEKAIGDGKIAIDKTIEMLDTEKGILNERITEQDKAKINSEQQQPILKNQEQGGKSIVDGYKAIAEKYADLQKNPEGKLPEELSKEELKDKTAFIKDLSNNNNSLGDKDKAVILDELVKYETERGEKAIGDGKIAIDKTIEMLDTEKGILNERITEQDKAKINSEQQQPILKNQEQGGKSIVDGYKAIAEKYADLQKNPEGKLPEELSKEELKDKTAFIKDLSNNNNSLDDKDKAVILDELVKYETERGEKAIGDGKIAIDKTIEMLDTEKGILNERITEQDKAKINSEQQQPILKNQEQGGKSIVDGYKAIAEKYADLQKNPEGKLPEELSKEELKDKTAFIKDLSNNNNSLDDKDKAVILDELVKYETERGEKAIGDGKIAIDKTIEMLDTEKGILNERITEQDKAKVSKETETAKLFSELPFHDNKAKEEILGVSETTTSPLQQVKTTQPPQPLHAEMDTVSTPSSTSENVQQVEALTAQLMANLEGSSSNRSTEEEAAKQKFYTSAKAVIDTTTELVDKIPDSKVIAKADNIKNILSNSAPIYSKENQKKQIIDEYNKQNTIDEQKVFIENKLVQNKGLSKEDRLGIIDDLIKQQDKRRSIAVEGPYDKDNKAATVSISLEETELKPISEEKPNIEKAQRQVDIDKVNVKGDVSIRAVLTEARGKINEEPTISVQNVANPKRQEIKR
ncbi:Sca4 family spreading effector [Rickettsia endosymbiont of Aspidapion aeneum]|uniref:Sca4 family spreading effector n=1 Tax=Rickettsia endosymbiont of Aspidapion aeneum TaxID=3066247 RepID=UPI00313EF13B